MRALRKMARETCLALEADDSDAGVVARASLAVVAGGMTVIDGRIRTAADLRERVHECRERLSWSTATLRRVREIQAVEAARMFPLEPGDNGSARVAFLLAVLKSIAPEWSTLELSPQMVLKFARQLALKRPAAATIAADLAERVGLEGPGAAVRYKKTIARSGT
ncbi:MAG: hypothetical protein KC776_32100 [Myxococcales bacterium]|nr:hypothetical protein [Myxococcales bacterium]MCB9580977.1 hypothetical protein [Polyangiaceae bacterium]